MDTIIPSSEDQMAHGARVVVPVDPYSVYPTKAGKLLAQLADELRGLDDLRDIDAVAADVRAFNAWVSPVRLGKDFAGNLNDLTYAVNGALDTRIEWVEFNASLPQERDRD